MTSLIGAICGPYSWSSTIKKVGLHSVSKKYLLAIMAYAIRIPQRRAIIFFQNSAEKDVPLPLDNKNVIFFRCMTSIALISSATINIHIVCFANIVEPSLKGAMTKKKQKTLHLPHNRLRTWNNDSNGLLPLLFKKKKNPKTFPQLLLKTTKREVYRSDVTNCSSKHDKLFTWVEVARRYLRVRVSMEQFQGQHIASEATSTVPQAAKMNRTERSSEDQTGPH